jgi:hypothetical protein
VLVRRLGRGALLAGLWLCGCGYSTGVRLPAGYETVGLSVFDNAGPEPRIERDLFASLSRQTSRMLAAEVRSPDRAELVIRGQILDYRRLSGVLSSEGQLQQSGVRVLLVAWIEDRRLGVRLGDPIQFDQSVRYVVRAGQEESGARREALDHIAQELVLDLFNQVDYRRSDQNLELPPAPLEPKALEPVIKSAESE